MKNHTEKGVWKHALSRFQLIDWDDPITDAEINDLKETLPKRKQDETTKMWLERLSTSIEQNKKESITKYIQRLFTNLKSTSELSAQEVSECLTDWVHDLNVNFNPVTEIVRYAASSITIEEYPLPDDIPLTTEDACFQFFIKKKEETILIEAQALGLAIEDYSNKLISLSDYDAPNDILAVIPLSDWAKGDCMVENNKTFRKMLMNPKIGCLSD